MKVVLLKDKAKVGRKYDVVDVADGYALNNLIPKREAKIATDVVLKEVSVRKEKADAERAEREEALKKQLSSLDGLTVAMSARANEKGTLFAGIEIADIVSLLSSEKGIDVNEEYIELPHAIKSVGDHSIVVSVGDEKATFTLSISAE